MSNLYMVYRRIHNFLYAVKPIRKLYYAVRINPRNRALSRKLVEDGERNLGLIVEALRGSGIRAFCAYGTLLGIVRDGGFIPYDTDMGILDDASFSWDALEKAMENCGLKKTCYYNYQGNVTEQRYLFPDGLAVDFFLFHREEPDMCGAYYYFKDHTVAYENSADVHAVMNCYPAIEGLTEMEFHGMRIPVPVNCEKHLEDVYGPGWKTPDPNYRHSESENRMPELGKMVCVTRR